MRKRYRWVLPAAVAAAAAVAAYLVVPACNVDESITAPGESQPPFWLWNAGEKGDYLNYLFKINPITGDVVASFRAPHIEQDNSYGRTGLTWGGGYLWFTLRKNDGNEGKLCWTRLEGTAFSKPDSSVLTYNEPTGLAWADDNNGSYLWSADRKTSKVYKIHIDNGPTGTDEAFSSPAPSPSGLAWDGTYLWVADGENGWLYKVEPVNGSVISSFRSPGPTPAGLAWDGTYLWNVDGYTGLIYKFKPRTLDRDKVANQFKAPTKSPWGLAVQGRFQNLQP